VTIRATIIEDSISPAGARLTTFELCYPRVIHAEFMTHRVFSRNASSSRAIPWARMKQWILDDPYVPIHWGKNQKGMQATEELTEDEQKAARKLWLEASYDAVGHADRLMSLGIHKQIVNRLVEPFGHINVICTATDFANFFALRIHKAAMPEIQCLTVRMARAYAASGPDLRRMDADDPHCWHLPYVSTAERETFSLNNLLAMSSARCARVSYRTHEGKAPTLEEDLKLFEQLVGGEPKHATPTEHQAVPLARVIGAGIASSMTGNLRGWFQHRKQIQGEAARPDFDWRARLVEWDGVDYVV
jgi:hypothetical protein